MDMTIEKAREMMPSFCEGKSDLEVQEFIYLCTEYAKLCLDVAERILRGEEKIKADLENSI